MNTFSLVTRSLAATENDPDKADLDERTREMGRVLTAVQTVVDTLTPAGAGRYVVGFANISTAGTSLANLHITVSARPLFDKRLTLVEKAVVIATFAAHEIGHTYVTRPRKAMVQDHNDKSGFHAIANLADDIVLEPYMVEKFPILADAFVFTGLWVLRTTSEVLPKVEAVRFGMSTAERVNLLISATRYLDSAPIVWADDDATREERVWCRDWASRLLALRVTDHAAYLTLCDEAWEHLRTEIVDEPEPEEEPEPEPDDEGEPEPGGDDEGEPIGPGENPPPDFGDEDEPEPTGSGQPAPEDDGDEPEDDEDGDDDQQSDEDGEDDGEGGSEDGEDSDGEDDDEDGGDTGSGDSEPDDDTTDKGDEPGIDGDEDGDDGPDEEVDSDDDDHGDNGGGNPDATIRDEDDFDEDDLDDTTHDQSEAKDTYDAERAEEAIRKFESTTVTTFGRHGHYSTEWE